MRKSIVLILLFGAFLCLNPLELSAKRDFKNLENNYLSFSALTPFGLGYKHHLGQNFFFVADLDYEKKDLRFRAGAAYFFPLKLLIFRFYSGGGFQYSRNEGYDYPYLTIGTRFLICYFEIIHPWEKKHKPEFRVGLSFGF
ncbi:MAG: hypothetical protein JSV17_10495 [Candidatus Aminicenantes bacterium]|nr:MAG: hypothetical protein JSV17_10495 [Candidatus Aminicenantes bacterium]